LKCECRDEKYDVGEFILPPSGTLRARCREFLWVYSGHIVFAEYSHNSRLRISDFKKPLAGDYPHLLRLLKNKTPATD